MRAAKTNELPKRGLKAIVLIAFAHAATVNAQDTSAKLSPAYEALQQAFHDLAKAGKTTNDSAVIELGKNYALVGSLAAPLPFMEMIRVDGGLDVTTHLPVTGQPERPPKDVDQVMAMVKDACAIEQGTLERTDIPDWSPSASVSMVATGLRDLTRRNMIGQFWCRSPSKSPLFLVQVRPAIGAKVPFLSFGWDWHIAFEVISPTVLDRHQARRTTYEQSTTDLRSDLKVGAQVQIPSQDLPDTLTEEWRKYRGNTSANFCALVTDVKGPLAQVQIGATQLAVEVQHLLPQGKKFGVRETTIEHLHQPQAWCIR